MAKTNMSRRGFVKAGAVAAAGAAVAGLSACNSSSAGSAASGSASDGSYAEKLPITIGYWAGSPCETPMYVAFMNNYWEKCGLEVNELLITSSTNDLLASDEIGCFEVTPGNFLGIFNGLNLKLIDTIHYGCFSGATLADSGIKSCADLAGKKIATTGMKAVAWIETMALAKRAGVDTSTIEWIVYKGSLMEQALLDGEVDAICNQDQTIQPIVEKNDGRVVHYYYSADDLPNEHCCYLGINDHILQGENGKEIADRLCKAWKMAIDYIQEDPEKAIEESMKAGYCSDVWPDAMKKLTKDYNFSCGDEEKMRQGLHDRYVDLVDCGLISDMAPDPSNTKEFESFINGCVDLAMEFHGVK